MKRILCILCALALLLAPAACGARPAEEPAVSEDLTVPEPAQDPPEEPTQEPTQEPDGSGEEAVPAVLSPGAAEASALSMPFQEKDGELYTGAAAGDGFVFIGDVLPIGESYVSSLLFCGAGTLAVVKEYSFSIDPSQLVLYPADGGEPQVLADNLVPSSRIVLAGDALFYLNWDDGAMYRYDMSTGGAEAVSDGVTHLFAAAGGFLYYDKDGVLYRNDSTGTAEAKLFATAGIGSIAADGGDLCLLLGSADGAAGSLEFRRADGSLAAREALAEYADNILCRNGRLYVPQLSAGQVLVFDLETAEALDPIALDTAGGSCLLHAVTDDALYYETILDAGLILCRVPLSGGPAEVVGSIIM